MALVLIEACEGRCEHIAVSVNRSKLVGLAQSRHLSTNCQMLDEPDYRVTCEDGTEIAIEEVEFL